MRTEGKWAMVIAIDNSQDLPKIQLPAGRRLQQVIELLADHTKGRQMSIPSRSTSSWTMCTLLMLDTFLP